MWKWFSLVPVLTYFLLFIVGAHLSAWAICWNAHPTCFRSSWSWIGRLFLNIFLLPPIFCRQQNRCGAFKLAWYILLVVLYSVFPALTCLIPVTRVLFTCSCWFWKHIFRIRYIFTNTCITVSLCLLINSFPQTMCIYVREHTCVCVRKS